MDTGEGKNPRKSLEFVSDFKVQRCARYKSQRIVKVSVDIVPAFAVIVGAGHETIRHM